MAEVVQNTTKALDEIKKIRKNGGKLDRVFEGTLNDGDKVTTEFKDGILLRSVKESENGFEKLYKEVDDKKVIKTTFSDGTKKEVNLSNIQETTKKAQENAAREAKESIGQINAKDSQAELAILIRHILTPLRIVL